MATITASQTKTRFGKRLDQKLRGERIVITQQAVAELRAGRALMAGRRKARSLSDREIKEAIEAGRP